MHQTEGNIAAISAKKAWIIIYLSKPQTIRVSKKFNSLIKSSTAVWIDPATGKTMAANAIDEHEGMDFIPPDWADAVLLIKANVK